MSRGQGGGGGEFTGQRLGPESAAGKALTRGEAGDALLVALHHFAACSVTLLPRDVGCHTR